MKNSLPTLDDLKKIAEYLPKDLYIVGGAIRNTFLGYEVKDIDLTGAMTPDEMETHLKGTSITLNLKNRAFGSVILKYKNFEIEYTTFRKDEYIGDGNYNKVKIKYIENIEEDAKRRDFSVNSIYFSLKTEKIIDSLNALNDIKTKTLKTFLKSNLVIEEDMLRALRGIRFASSLDLRMTEELQSAIKLNADKINNIPKDKVMKELSLIFVADTVNGISDGHIKGIDYLNDLSLLNFIIPELYEGMNVNQRSDFHKYDVMRHNFNTYYQIEGTLILRLAGLLHDIGKPRAKQENGRMTGHQNVGAEMAKNILRRLKFSEMIIEKVSLLVYLHMFNLKCNAPIGELILFIQDYNDIIDDLIKLKNADNYGGGIFLKDSPSAIKFVETLEYMKINHIPRSISELLISDNEVKDLLGKDRAKEAIHLLLKQTSFNKELLTRKGQLNFISELSNN